LPIDICLRTSRYRPRAAYGNEVSQLPRMADPLWVETWQWALARLKATILA